MIANPTWAYTTQDAVEANLGWAPPAWNANTSKGSARAGQPHGSKEPGNPSAGDGTTDEVSYAASSQYYLPADLMGCGGGMPGGGMAFVAEDSAAALLAAFGGGKDLQIAHLAPDCSPNGTFEGRSLETRERRRRQRRRKAFGGPDEPASTSPIEEAMCNSAVAALFGGTPVGYTGNGPAAASTAPPPAVAPAAAAAPAAPAAERPLMALPPERPPAQVPLLGTLPPLWTAAVAAAGTMGTVSATPAVAAGPDAQLCQALSPSAPPKWHSSALSAGSLSEDGHIFAKMHAGPQKSHSNGMKLSSLCMLFERNLRMGGLHRYRYTILGGSVGAADGVGFVFDSRLRRTNIQRMKSVFLNKHGQVCIRNLDRITKLPCSLPKLAEGVTVYLTVDLDQAQACFRMEDARGKQCGTADLSFASLFAEQAPLHQQQESLQSSPELQPQHLAPTPCATPTAAVACDATSVCTSASASSRSGFFCAIVTGGITVSLQ